jgi:hypothetical protein
VSIFEEKKKTPGKTKILEKGILGGDDESKKITI